MIPLSIPVNVLSGQNLHISASNKIDFFIQTFSVKKLGSSPGRFANATLVRLSEFLSAGYKKGVRPVKDWRTSTLVAIDLMVYSILNVVSYTLLHLPAVNSDAHIVISLKTWPPILSRLSSYAAINTTRPQNVLCGNMIEHII